ncbi:MAG: cysteine desulfurase family protein [Patescibacteria group bacterium]
MQKSKNKLRKIYMDYASGAPLDMTVLKKVTEVMKKDFANPSAIHDLGISSKKILEKSRESIANILGARPVEIIFTSGATESNNLAVLGILKSVKIKNFIPHIVTTNIEHASVLELCKFLEKEKLAEVSYVEVEENGIVDSKKIKKAIKQNTILVSVMYVNNEIGTVQPIQEIAKEIRHYKKQQGKVSQYPIFHTDATQAINYLSLKVEKLGVDLLSFNGSKIYGPKGVGVLFIKKDTVISNIIYGGDQEFGFRPGTENTALVFGLSEAMILVERMKDKEVKRLVKLQEYFLKKLQKINGLIINGDFKNRIPNNVNITIPKIPSDLLVLELNAQGVCISEKSACKTGEKKSSHVIDAIRLQNKDKNIAKESLRFSMGRDTSKEDIDYVVQVLNRTLEKLNKWYN